MKHLHNLKDANLASDSLVTIGVFDGVHLGHQQLIRRVVASSRASRRKAIVLTFYPHPDKVLDKVKTRYYLTTPKKRADLLLDLGVDLVITHPFDDETRHLPAADFIDLLVDYLRVKEIWVGADFAFGFQREGDVRFLRAQGEKRGFEVRAMELITSQASQQLISSTTVREHVRKGNSDGGRRNVGARLCAGGRRCRRRAPRTNDWRADSESRGRARAAHPRVTASTPPGRGSAARHSRRRQISGCGPPSPATDGNSRGALAGFRPRYLRRTVGAHIRETTAPGTEIQRLWTHW